MTRVLIVDDDPVQLRLTAEAASRAGFATLLASSGREALDRLRGEQAIDAVVLDLVMPDLDGMAVLEAMGKAGIAVPVIVQTANSSLETVVSAMRAGAADFVVKPVAPERLVVSLKNVLKLESLEALVRSERARKTGTLGLNDIVTRAPIMDKVMTLAAKAARSPIPVLIEGETGVGKEMIARAIQGSSDRAGKPFIIVNCGAIPLNLVESTLFGHRKGAFTGAVADRPGKFQEAHGGTLFLDEVGELPLETQVKLLRAIQSGEVEPVGSGKAERVNVRVISATNQRLLNLAKAGAFREDLYYRLNVFPVYVPPLRERPEDIVALAEHFILKLSAESGKRIAGLTPEALALLKRYNWPGNVRQLENALYRAVVLCEGDRLDVADFPQVAAQLSGREEAVRLVEAQPMPAAPVHIDLAEVRRREAPPPPAEPDRFVDEEGGVRALDVVERDLIAFALKHYGGHMSRVARALGIGRSTLYRKLREYGLDEGVADTAA